MKRVVFLERNNTVILDNGYTHKIEDLEFLPKAVEGMKKLQKEFPLIITTNQEGIPMGRFKYKDYKFFKDHMHSKLKGHGVNIISEYHCPHLPQGNVDEYVKECDCHKPNPGMFLQAKKDFNVNLEESWVIGTKISDVKAGKNVGSKTIGIPSRESTIEELKNVGADFVFNNLSEAADFILGNKNINSQPEVYPKVWGVEHWITNNEKYCGKRMEIKEEFYSSYHMHKIKEETFYVLSGELEVIHEGEHFTIKEGEILHVKPKEYHSFRSSRNTVFFEFSTQHFDEDNYRLTKSSQGTQEKWKKEIKNVLDNISKSEVKIKTLDEMKIITENLKHQNKKIVTTNGVFDLLHHSHISLLKKAKNVGDVLIVLLNSDNSVKKNKGPENPVIPEKERAEMLAALGDVDHVLIFDENKPLNILEELKPHYHIKGGKFLSDRLEEERKLLETWHGKLINFDSEEGSLTTEIIERIVDNNKNPEIAVFDLDGVISKDKIFTKSKDSEKILEGQSENLDILKKYLKEKNVRSIAVTGRSLEITKPLLDKYMDDLCVCEHGTVIYNPQNGETYHLVDGDEKFNNLRNAKSVLESFIAKSSEYDDEIKKNFPNSNISRMDTNLHILTYEFQAEKNFSTKFFEFISKKILPREILDFIKKGELKVLHSDGAIDIKPNLSKAEGLKHVLSKLKIDPKNILIAGDSYHSDFDMMKIFPQSIWICPGNSDERLKKEIISKGRRGFVSEKNYFEGTMEILNNLIK